MHPFGRGIFANILSECLYHRLFQAEFLYVSPNPMFLCGQSQERVRELGYRFYLDYVPENELSLLLSINRTGFAFYNDIPVEERKDWYISYDFHILNKGRKILVNHKLTPLRLTSDGRVWLALCVVSAATHTDAGHIEMHHIGTSDFFEYNTVSRKWKRKQIPTLTDGENLYLHFPCRDILWWRLQINYACLPTR